MKLYEANESLKLECALRELGFIQFDWKVVAHAGLYFIRPVGIMHNCNENDDLLGFQLSTEDEAAFDDNNFRLGLPILQTAKRALDFALMTYI